MLGGTHIDQFCWYTQLCELFQCTFSIALSNVRGLNHAEPMLWSRNRVLCPAQASSGRKQYKPNAKRKAWETSSSIIKDLRAVPWRFCEPIPTQNLCHGQPVHEAWDDQEFTVFSAPHSSVHETPETQTWHLKCPLHDKQHLSQKLISP